MRVKMKEGRGSGTSEQGATPNEKDRHGKRATPDKERWQWVPCLAIFIFFSSECIQKKTRGALSDCENIFFSSFEPWRLDQGDTSGSVLFIDAGGRRIWFRMSKANDDFLTAEGGVGKQLIDKVLVSKGCQVFNWELVNMQFIYQTRQDKDQSCHAQRTGTVKTSAAEGAAKKNAVKCASKEDTETIEEMQKKQLCSLL